MRSGGLDAGNLGRGSSHRGGCGRRPRVLRLTRGGFPLSVGPGERYLVDAAGRPFLIHGDTAWSLIAQLTREDVELYLDDRRARGFNTILVNLIESRFARTRQPTPTGSRRS